MHITHINLAKGFNGGERQTALLISHLATQGVNQCLVCRKDSSLRKHLKNTQGLEFQTSKNMFLGHRFGYMKTDLFHAHDAKAAHWAFLESQFYNIPYIITRRVPNPLKNFGITPIVYKKASAVIAISSTIKHILKDYNPRLFTPLIPSAVGGVPHRPENIKQLQARYKDRFVIGHIGTLKDRAKGQKDLIEAARLLNAKYDNFYFVFLGKGEDEHMFQTMAENMNNVEFAGFTEYPGDWLSVMNLFAFPSPQEGLGSSILDAMAYGVPVIASNVGGIPDIVQNDKNGILIPPRNCGALADAIARLYENPKLRKQFVRNGYMTAAAHSSVVMGERYLTLYRKILRRSTKS